MSEIDLLSSLYALVQGLQHILMDTRFSDSARVEAALRMIASAQTSVYDSAPKPASMAAAAGGGGGGGSSEPHKTSIDPKTIFSYAGALATGALKPKPAHERRPDQPPAPKQKSKKAVPKEELDDNGTPAHWTKKIRAILAKPNEELTKEDIKCIWDFLWNVLPHRTFPDNIFTKLVYGEHPFLLDGKRMPLHNYLREHHPIKSIRDFFNRVYDEDGNCLLFKDDAEDSE